MNKVNSSRGKYKFINIFSFAMIVIGGAIICWSLINIREETRYLDNVYTNQYYSSVDYIVKEPELIIDDTDKIDVDKIYNTNYPANGDIIGSLVIPSLNQELPIIQGTGYEELKKGVGHFKQSVLPGQEDNSVLSGHRNTVFSELGDLMIGDSLIIKTIAGTFTYIVDGTRIVDKDDKTVIVPTDTAILTLTTCYPFDGIDLDPSERYILTASLVTE